MRPTTLRLLLGLSLAGTLALAWLVSEDDRGIAASAPLAKHGVKSTPERGKALRVAATASVDSAVGDRPLLGAARPPEPTEVPDLFRGVSWYVPPPPPPPPAPARPPEPTAPPLPFAYLGQYSDDDRRLFILTRGDRVMTVAIGDVIDKTYLLESATGGVLRFVHVPLRTTQTLNTGVLQ